MKPREGFPRAQYSRVPAASENAATAREIALAESYGVPVHICHVSTAVSAALYDPTRKRGASGHCETALITWMLTEEELRNKNADWRMSPPLRTEADRKGFDSCPADDTLEYYRHRPRAPTEEVGGFLQSPTAPSGWKHVIVRLLYGSLVKPGI